MPKSFEYRASRSLNPAQRKQFERAVADHFAGKFTLTWTDNHEPVFHSTAENHPTDSDLQHFVAGFYHALK